MGGGGACEAEPPHISKRNISGLILNQSPRSGHFLILDYIKALQRFIISSARRDKKLQIVERLFSPRSVP